MDYYLILLEYLLKHKKWFLHSENNTIVGFIGRYYRFIFRSLNSNSELKMQNWNHRMWNRRWFYQKIWNLLTNELFQGSVVSDYEFKNKIFFFWNSRFKVLFFKDHFSFHNINYATFTFKHLLSIKLLIEETTL